MNAHEFFDNSVSICLISARQGTRLVVLRTRNYRKIVLKISFRGFWEREGHGLSQCLEDVGVVGLQLLAENFAEHFAAEDDFCIACVCLDVDALYGTVEEAAQVGQGDVVLHLVEAEHNAPYALGGEYFRIFGSAEDDAAVTLQLEFYLAPLGGHVHRGVAKLKLQLHVAVAATCGAHPAERIAVADKVFEHSLLRHEADGQEEQCKQEW